MLQNAVVQIVVIEDCDEDAELILRALRRGNVSSPIVRLRDGEEALMFLTRERPDRPRQWPKRVVLLDLDLPKASGIEVLRKLRSNTNTRGLPVVILTGSSENRHRSEADALGANKYMVKPLLAQAVSEIVDYAASYWTAGTR